jgi:hypothetical protein
MGNQVEIVNLFGVWTQKARDNLQKALTRASVDELIGQTKNGAALFAIVKDCEQIGHFVLRIDVSESRKEGVIVAGFAEYQGESMLDAVVPHIEALFAKYGCDSVRYHTISRGVVRMMAKHGYTDGEIVCVKVLNSEVRHV